MNGRIALIEKHPECSSQFCFFSAQFCKNVENKNGLCHNTVDATFVKLSYFQFAGKNRKKTKKFWKMTFGLLY